MSNPSRHEGDHYFAGAVTVNTLAVVNGTFGDDNIGPAAGIAASKLEHQYEVCEAMTTHTEDAVARRKVIHVAYGATGDILAFHAGSTVVTGASTSVTLQLKKNGTNILSSVITLNDTVAAFAKVAAAGFTSTTFVAGDVFEAEIVSVTGANPPKGVFVRLTIREDAD